MRISCNKGRIAEKLKTTRKGCRKACDSGRKSGGGRIILTFYGLCENLLGGSPAVNSLPNAIYSPLEDQLLLTTFVNKFSDDLSPTQPASFEDEKGEIWKRCCDQYLI